MIQFILFVAILNFILGFYVLINNYKKPINFSFSLSTFLIGLWVLLNYFFLKYPSIHILRAIYSIAPFVIVSIARWINILEKQKLTKSFLKVNYLLYIVNIFFVFLMFSSEKMISNVNSPFDYSTGPLFNIFTGYILLLFLGFIIYFIIQYQRDGKIFKDQMRLISIGIGITISIAAIVGFILPSIGISKFNFFDSPSSIFFIIFSTYSIIKYKFLDVRIIGTQVFATFLSFLTFLGLLNSVDFNDFIFNFILFLITAVFALLLIHSVIVEGKRRQEVENLNNRLDKAAKDLKAKAAHLEKLLQMRTEFLDIASHQLKTPISVIRGTLSMFEEGSMDKLPKEEQKRFFHSMCLKADKLNAIISDILRASEMDTDEFKIDYATSKPEDLQEMAKSVLEQLQSQADEKKIELKLEVLENNLPAVMTSGEFLEQAIYNLVDNALKYTKEGYVKIILSKENNSAIIKVEDSGVGIPEKESAKIFDKFARGRHAVDMYADGSGLGLFIVKKIVEAHQGGQISVTSTEGKGTTFTISLPFNVKDVKSNSKSLKKIKVNAKRKQTTKV